MLTPLECHVIFEWPLVKKLGKYLVSLSKLICVINLGLNDYQQFIKISCQMVWYKMTKIWEWIQDDYQQIGDIVEGDDLDFHDFEDVDNEGEDVADEEDEDDDHQHGREPDLFLL